MDKYFGNKPFLKHQDQGFEQFTQFNSDRVEEENFLKKVKIIHRDQNPIGSKMIRIHTIHKVEKNDVGYSK